MNVACSSCGQLNRVPTARLTDKAHCAACKTSLLPLATPIALQSAEEFDELVRAAPVPVLVDFWAVWCGPCQEEIPELVELYHAYRDKGFVIVGVSDPSDLRDIKSFVNDQKMDYPVVIDEGSISDEYNVVGFPTSFLIDREGRIVQKYPGYSPSLRRKLEAQIQKLI